MSSIAGAARMRFEGVRKAQSSPNLTPLIDIVFLLLVFFMLTAHFVKDEGIAIELPQAESAVSREDDAALLVLLDKQGRILVDGTVVNEADLEQQLRIRLQNREQKWVTLKGDKGADLGGAVAILDAARKAGATSVDVVTERP